jgi:putative ABC transport system ATP-binding protein
VGTLELRDLVKHHRIRGGEPVRAVDGVSLVVAPGELIALYGPSGSGKTTLLLLLAGLLKPDSGSVLFDGRNVDSMSSRERASYLARDVGFVFQSFHLMPGSTALENSTLKLSVSGYTRREARELAIPWLERFGLGDRLEHRPEQLSMGERQRVSIVRALVNEPQLLLADEPTGNLDFARTREILALLRDICHEQGIPGVIVTHDADTKHFVDRTYTLRDGALVEDADAGRTDRLTPAYGSQRESKDN